MARALARKLGGEIISVDSMKIYRRMNIGTATPPENIQAEIKHHCIDIVEPSDAFSVAQYVKCAEDSAATIRSGGAIPLAVGGTSLYIKAMTEGLFQGPPTDTALRAELSGRVSREGLSALYDELCRVDPVSAERIHPNDEKRILRALEVFLKSGTPISELQTQWDSQTGPSDDCILIGLRRERDDLHGRINRRVKKMVEMGLRDEVENLLAEPAGLSQQACQAVGYAELIEYFQGREKSFDKAIERVKINTRRLAKKQRTWHRRWQQVQWFGLAEDQTAEQTVERLLKEIDFK